MVLPQRNNLWLWTSIKGLGNSFFNMKSPM
jgi:hypothetical protein